jgi:hypothetical protein
MLSNYCNLGQAKFKYRGGLAKLSSKALFIVKVQFKVEYY